ncbi:heme-binding protein [Streptomyces sp. NPDC001984]
MHPGRFAAFVGGFPVVHDDQVVGAVGVSGGNGEQDKAVGAAALSALASKVAAGRVD